MSAISTLLTRLQNTLSTLRAAIWAIDVRDDIADAIEECGQMVEQCYSDVSNPTLQTEALEAALQNKIDQGEMAALTIGDRTITAVKLANGVIPAADATLTTSGGYADAAETGRQIGKIKADLYEQTERVSELEDGLSVVNEQISGIEEEIDNFEPLSDNIKMALLECFQNVAWIGADSKTYYDNLVNALHQSIYSIDVPTTFNGTSDYIDTGIQLFDTDKSFTIFCDCTEDTEYPLLRYYQIFHCMMSNGPWTGIEASLRKTDENDKSPIRIAYYGGTESQSYDSTTGVGNRNVKIAVSHKSASSSLSIAVSVNDNLVLYDNVAYRYGFNEKTLVIGTAKKDDGTLTSNFFKGTINNFKLYNVSFSLNDLRNMVLNGGAQ